MAAQRILFVTSNGTGLGHLTRSMAIARRLDASLEPLFITFSAGAPVVHDQGFPVEYIASYDRPGAGTDLTWTLRTRERLRAAVGEIEPAVVMFDGTHPYERLLPVLRLDRVAPGLVPAGVLAPRLGHRAPAPHAPSTLCSSRASWTRARTAGRLRGRRAEAEVVDPDVLLDRLEPAPRSRAERALGLEPGRRNVLGSSGREAGPGRRPPLPGAPRLGAGDPGRGPLLAPERARRRPRGRGQARVHLPDLPVVRGRSTPPLRPPATTPSRSSSRHGCLRSSCRSSARRTIRPLGRGARSVRALASPSPGPTTRRSRRAWTTPGRRPGGQLRGLLEALPEWRAPSRRRAGSRASPRTGPRLAWATAAARRCEGPRQARLDLRPERPAHAGAGDHAAAAAAAHAVVVLALGLDEGAPRGRARPRACRSRRGARAGAGDHRPPRLREPAAGGGRIRARAEAGERQPELAGGPYERFRARRIGLIRARRPRPRRVIELR